MKTPEIRKPYYRARVQTESGGESVTDKSFGNDTNVNNIVARFARTGEMPTVGPEGQFADVTRLQGDLSQMICEAKDTLKYMDELKSAQAEKVKSDLEKRLKRAEELEKRYSEEETATTEEREE